MAVPQCDIQNRIKTLLSSNRNFPLLSRRLSSPSASRTTSSVFELVGPAASVAGLPLSLNMRLVSRRFGPSLGRKHGGGIAVLYVAVVEAGTEAA